MASSFGRATYTGGALGFAGERPWSGLRVGQLHLKCSVPQNGAHRAVRREASSSSSSGRSLVFSNSLLRKQLRDRMTSAGPREPAMPHPSSLLSSRRKVDQGRSKLRAAASDEPMSEAERSQPQVPQLIEGVPLTPLMGILAALLAVLLLTRLVNPADILLSVASLAYALFLAQWTVPPRADLPSAGLTPRQQLKDFGTAKWFRIYFMVFRAVGVLVPLAYSIAAFSLGEFVSASFGFSYLFHLLSQILGEASLATSTRFSLPGYFFIPIMFNSGRLIRLWQWWQAAYAPHEAAAFLQLAFTVASQAVATSLMALWVVNLFCLLLPVSLPLGFKRYCGAEPIPGITDSK